MPRMCPGATVPPPPGGEGAGGWGGGVPVLLSGACDLLQESSNSWRALIIKRVINLNGTALIIIYYCWIHSQEAAPNC